MLRNSLILFSSFFLMSCAQLHHVQIGDIDSHPDFAQKPFEIKISEVGVSTEEISAIANHFGRSNAARNIKGVADVVSLFQMGPRTGSPVYTKDYAKGLLEVLYEKCPSGNITGLMSIRETRKYPVISGEIVKVTGYCLIKKGKS